MVLVCNEWLKNNVDEDQTPSPAQTSASGSVGSTALNRTITADTATEIPQTTYLSGEGLEPNVKQKKSHYALNMETDKKVEHDQFFHIMEISELHMADSNNDTSIENQENNNMEVCDSNTGCIDRRTAEVSQHAINMAMNSVLNANNTGVGVRVTTACSLFSPLGVLNNSALQREVATECGTLQVASVPTTSTVDLDIGSETVPTACMGAAKIVLHCESKSHKFETRSIFLQPNQDCKVGRLIAKSKAGEGNAIFDCKVLSRNHAILWYTPDGKFWVKDTKSSNGTFINDNKLGSDPAELHYGDIVKFGVEVIENSRQEVHGCILARVALFLPNGQEAISVGAEQMLLTVTNRISFDEVQRLNAFLQEAAQREKSLKAKLSSLQGVLDTTRKNSAMCWQSMITEDQLLHKINLLEKKLQMMEKNIPENALRNEIVKLLEDKTTYQLTAKEALRKVYQERCDAMQMLSKMEMAYATSENECGILRAQVITLKETLNGFNCRLEELQQEYMEFKKESVRQEQESEEQKSRSLELLNMKLSTQERELKELRVQASRVHQVISEHDTEKFKEQIVLKHLNTINSDDDHDHDHAVGGAQNEKDYKESLDDDILSVSQDKDVLDIDQQTVDSVSQEKKVKLRNPDLQPVSFKSSVLKLLKNSDLGKGEEGSSVLKAIFNCDDEGFECKVKEDMEKALVTKEFVSRNTSEIVHHFNNYSPSPQILEDSTTEISSALHLESKENLNIPNALSTEQTIDMLQDECYTYKKKTAHLTSEIHFLQTQIELLKKKLEKDVAHNFKTSLQNLSEESSLPRETLNLIDNRDSPEDVWNQDIETINNPKVEKEEELIVYKELLEHSELKNMQLRKEISELHSKQKHNPFIKQGLLSRFLPLGCIAIGLLLYFLSNRI
ncbi:sarcolemmal membrane-associated protein-like isoform X1 [Drosophila teissieri]|uniref:sarcolemmal membrane-associated protein-like isoform X1 n=1 Tax=Drosophila teissieri TaxID=7243 RepID=UPI001CBA0BEF|nr:sarcolemmal membrane-associated protein-like isoform X1 [Drosophila teissieri]XP_043661568.1 sarcolemmal membrane-associated protein-like isoform X1 [Drosophila teissieri]